MKHLGDITKLHGGEIPRVNVIIGGSPCQDLSVAGKQEGLAGTRSSLFLDQIRIVKQMREADISNGRTGKDIRPRFMVWENVPGAFSSNKSADFAAVLTETVRIVEPKAPAIPIPKHGWPTAGCISGMGSGGGYSIAYRVFDAQFWGVPQRRRRIALICDFGGFTAPEILFERESVRGNTSESGDERERTAPAAKSDTGASSGPIAFNMTQTPVCGDIAPCLSSGNPNKGQCMLGVYQPAYCIQGNCIDRADTAGCNGRGWTEDVSYTLNTIDRPAVAYGFNTPVPPPQIDKAVHFAVDNHPQDSRVSFSKDGKVQTLSAQMGTGGGNVPMIYSIDRASFNQGVNAKYDMGIEENGPAYTLTARGPGAVCFCKTTKPHSKEEAPTIVESDISPTLNTFDIGESRTNHYIVNDIAGTLDASYYKGCGSRGNIEREVVLSHGIVRRLTPLECERLQGFPCMQEVKFTEMTKDEYIAWNINEGHIIVDAENGKVYATRGPGGIMLQEPRELKGTNLNGYLAVNIRNGETKMLCRIHRIVWIAEHGIIPEGYVVDHINSNKHDNRINNLQLLTAAENSTKAAHDGLYRSGSDNPATRIPDEVHDLIRYVYGNTDLTIRQLSEVFGISKSRVHQIIHEKGWTDIGDWTDSKGKLHKGESNDNARYKALGNSIALPSWAWVLARLTVACGADVTMGSLFDGIGGFPLIWERLNGRGSCLWASEIEEFPIAVTKRHFPEE